MAENVIHGVPASPGIAVGPAYVHCGSSIEIPDRLVPESDIPLEISLFKEGLTKAESQLKEVLDRAQKNLGEEEAEVFEGHIEILMDEDLGEEIIDKIRNCRLPALRAISEVIRENAEEMEVLEDEYMRERAADIKDIGKRLMFAVAGKNLPGLNEITTPSVVIAHDLAPSETALMDRKNVLAIVTEAGGQSSHVAIMAKSLEIPAIVGADSLLKRIEEGDHVAVDALNGFCVLSPTSEQQLEFSDKIEQWKCEQKELSTIKDLPAETTDGHRVEIAANIGTDADVEAALRHGAEGVGLFRTEFLFMDREQLPSEEEQFQAYKKVAKAMSPRPVIIRTMDIGGDKELSYLNIPKEENPFLGWRAIRMCLDRPKMFQVQLRAILRAACFGNIRIMFPMIDSIKEVQSAKKLVSEAVEELKQRGESYNENIEIGLMIETPAAAVMASKLIEEVDFFSIGTNDLTQYTLAVDRGNRLVSRLYQPLHPAVLSLIKNTIDAAHAAGKWVGMCGEIASNEAAALILVGMGLDELSMSAVNIGKVKKYIRSHALSDLQKVAKNVLDQGKVSNILSLVETLQ